MTHAHTPGPWGLQAGEHASLIWGAPPDHNAVLVARIQREGPIGGATHIADVRLMAVAPTMLAALLTCRDILDSLTTEQFTRGGDKPAREAITEALRAAGVEVEE